MARREGLSGTPQPPTPFTTPSQLGYNGWVRVLDALMFFPRGGSAHVARALAEELPAHGWDVTVVSGSLGGRGVCDAERFYAGLDVHAVDFNAGDAPMH